MVKTIDKDDFKILIKDFPDKWEYLNEKLDYAYESFNSVDDYEKPTTNLKKGNFFGKFRKDFAKDCEIKQTREILDVIVIKNGEQFTELYLKSDVILFADMFDKFVKESIEEFDINLLYCTNLPLHPWSCGLKDTDIKLKTLQKKN